MTEESGAQGLDDLLVYLKASRGFDFSVYKRSTLGRRIAQRMNTVSAASHAEYIDYLEVHPDEFDLLFNTILINVTSFFRDPPAWDYLREQIIPRMLEAKEPGSAVRVWSAGCSSGEEAYTAAILLAEALGPEGFRERVKIYGTDIDSDAIAAARAGAYTERDVAAVPEQYHDRYFELQSGRLCFRKELRRNLVFGRHDLTSDAPISRVDLLISRNTLMYFNVEAQSGILERFFFALSPAGTLFLGKAEMLLTRAHVFTAVDLKSRMFMKADRANGRERMSALVERIADERFVQAQHDAPVSDVAFEADPSAQLLVDADGQLTHANRAARDLFDLTVQSLGRPLQELPLAYRPFELYSLIEEARADRHVVTRTNVPQAAASGAPCWFDLQIVPLVDRRGQPLGVKVNLVDVTRFQQLQLQLDQTHHALETAYEELQSSNEELETTNEELQSTIEELETTNEELQATNEELETINEELQATNEEMETVNAELAQRGDEVVESNLFLESILSSMNAGVIVVGRDFRVRAWNGMSTELWGLRADEVRGSHFLSLDFGLPTSQLSDALRDTIQGQSAGHSQVLRATNRRGRAISCRVSIEPLKSPATEELQGALLVVDDMEESPQPSPDEGT